MPNYREKEQISGCHKLEWCAGKVRVAKNIF